MTHWLILVAILIGGAIVVQSNLKDDALAFEEAYRDPATRLEQRITADRYTPDLGKRLTPLVKGLPQKLQPTPASIAVRQRAIGMRVATLINVLPLIIPLLIAVFMLGMARREAAGRGQVWSSSTFTRLGYYGIVISVIAVVTFIFSSAPYWSVYIPLALAVASVYSYVGNMPCRL